MVAKRFFYVCAGILCLALAYHLGAQSATAQSGGGRAAPQTTQKTAPSTEEKTKFERFTSRKGSLIVKEYYAVGKIQGDHSQAKVDAAVVSSPGDPVKAYALRFEIQGYSSSAIAALDFDEATTLSSDLTRMIEMAQKMASGVDPYTEVTFESLAGFRAGFLQTGNEQTAFILGSNSNLFFKIEDLPVAKATIDAGVAKLRALGAK